jgi:polar amino acid transport system ATP-binding protein
VRAGYGGLEVLSGVTFSVDKGEVVALVGPSGSGKSTVLRVLMGLTPPSAGTVEIDGTAIDYRRAASVRAARDRMAIVFQQYNLFQNMDVMRNVTLAPLRIKRRDRAEVETDAIRLLEQVGLADKHHAYPDELSGGQQQRVAIARALALRPEILLLDEVTSALDPELVAEVLNVIRELAASGMTMIIATHEMGFARDIASRVLFLDEGRILEEGPPDQIFSAPREPRTREFLQRIIEAGRLTPEG